MVIDFVASTGRTATTYLASVLNDLDGVVACHEGYVGSDKSREPLLPLINLENAQAYALDKAAERIVAEKRSRTVLEPIWHSINSNRIIDVAYYNSTLASALLSQNPESRMVAIIRGCEGFVRSATTLEGEDPLPVGWPRPTKELTNREKFIAMGRIRPRKGTKEKSMWAEWSAISRNIWLWKETNRLLIDAKERFPDRVCLCRFDTFKTNPSLFWRVVSDGLKLDLGETPPQSNCDKFVNKKPTGYQIGEYSTWTDYERHSLEVSEKYIEERANYDC